MVADSIENKIVGRRSREEDVAADGGEKGREGRC